MAVESNFPGILPTEAKTSTELERLIRRCIAGYLGEQDLTLSIVPMRGHVPNWTCLFKYDGPSSAEQHNPLMREIAALKRRFHLRE